MKNPTIGVAVITYRAKHHLPFCLPPFLTSPLKPRVVVVNSSSYDGTVELAEEMGVETLIIPRAEFNHGTTREKARQYLNTDIVVMVTPDAYATDKHVLERLVEPIILKKSSASYARQIPHDGADIFEAFAREFNYPSTSHVRSLNDINTYGVYTYFCSDSCAAYSNEALDEVGGFPDVLTGEDTVVVAKMLQKGRAIAYVAEACVNHSHRYTLWQEFQRHFDTGLARKEYSHLLQLGGCDEKRGKDYVISLMRRLMREQPLLLPYAALQSIIKWIGYRLGRSSGKAPLWFKKALSGQDFYWKS
jgi:rhamnosyltransferase